MPRRGRPAASTRARFSDRIVPAKPGEHVGLGVTIDRSGADYRAGVSARRAGEPRDGRKPVAWLPGWDESAPQTE